MRTQLDGIRNSMVWMLMAGAMLVCNPAVQAQQVAESSKRPRVPDAPAVTLPAGFHHPEIGEAGPAIGLDYKWWKEFNDPLLDELIEASVSGNIDLKTAEARVREARAALGVSRSRQRPSLDTATSYNRLRGPVNPLGFIRPGAQSNVFQIGFDASWELDLFGGVRASVAAAAADAQAAEEARHGAMITVMAEVARQYVQLRGLQNEWRVTAANLAIQKDLAQLTRVRLEAGLATALDLERAEAQAEATAAALPLLQSGIAQSIYGLSVLAGKEPGALETKLAASAPIPIAPTPNPGQPSDLLRRRPDLRRAEAEIAAAFARVKVARADLYPKFNLGALFGRQGNSLNGFSLGLGNFFSLGPTVSLPIFSGGRIKANIRAQDARQEQAQRNFEDTVLQALLEVENAMVEQSEERARLDALSKSLAASRRAVKLSEELYSLGQESFLSVLEAQRTQYEIEAQKTRSERDVSLYLVMLYKALGGGWAIENITK